MNYKSYLTDDILDFWIKKGIDNQDGGILTSVDKFGTVKDTTKNIWFTGRALWSYSLAYRLIEAKKEYLDTCKTLFDFFDKCTLPNGKLPHSATKEGECIVHRDLYYSEGFAAMGCAQYYRISGDEKAKKRAEDYFDIAYNQYYDPEMSIPVAPGGAPYVSFGLEMFMLSVAQFVRNANIRVEECNRLASTCIQNMQTRGHVKDDLKTVIEYLPTTDKPLEPKDDLNSCPGHIYEAAWFVMCEGVEKNNKEYVDFGVKLLEYAMPQGFEKTSSIIPTMFGKLIPETYIWWPQCEAIIAFKLAHNLTQNQKYLNIANQIEKFAFDHFADFENGEWYAQTDKDGNVVDSDKGTFIKGPFHIPRMLFGLISLEETGSIKNYMS